MRGLAALALLAAIAACTFPSVDYVDDAGSSGGGGCKAPATCATDAAGCATPAQNKHRSCVHQCKDDAACVAVCDDTQRTALGKCAAACESCAAPRCGGAATNCDALVGL